MVSVRPILAGDPSRGALSLDTEANIKPGQYVQFLHDAADTKEHTHSVRVNDASSLIFSETSAGHSSSLGPHASFLGSSEHGYVVGRPKQSSWICSVTGSSAKLAL
jgi:small ligand-binding sensory domain FIST